MNQEWLMSVSGRSADIVSYPYGGSDAVSESVMKIAQNNGHIVGLTMERAVNLSLKQPMALARLDTNDALGGKKPLMHMKGGKLALHNDIINGRRWFVDESRPVH